MISSIIYPSLRISYWLINMLYADLLDFQTRADIRIRIRSIVIRIRIRHTAIRIRIVVPAIDHTDYWGTLPLAKLLI